MAKPDPEAEPVAAADPPPAARTADDVLEAIRPAQSEVRLCLDGRLNLEQARLIRRLDEAQAYDEAHNDPDTAPTVAAELQALQGRIHAAEHAFTLQAIPGPDWRDLEAAHPPTEQQRERQLPHNPETFWPVLVARSIIDPPGWTADRVGKLHGALGDGQWQRITDTIWALNRGAGAAPLSRAALKILRGFDASSTT